MTTKKSDLKKFFDLPALCPAFNIRAASRVITQLFDDILKPSGLQITQFAVLVGVYTLDSPKISQLAKGLVMDRTTLTRNLQPLEKQGLIKKLGNYTRSCAYIKSWTMCR